MKTPSPKFFAWCLAGCLPSTTPALEIAKLFNSTALNSGSAWSGGVAPGGSDVMMWNSMFTDTVASAANLSLLGGSRSVSGIKVTTVGGTRDLPERFIGIRDTSSASTLTLGASGIDASAATQCTYLEPAVTIGANQTWNVGDANLDPNPSGFDNNEDLVFNAQVINTAFNFGGKTVTTAGLGQITISSGYTLSNGTLISGNDLMVIQGGRNRTTTLANTLNLQVNSGRLRLQSNSGVSAVSLTSAAPVTVNGGTFEMRSTNKDFSFTQSGPITLNANTELSFSVGSSGPMTCSSNITVAGNAYLYVSGTGNPVDGVMMTGNLLGSGNLNYRNSGTSLFSNPPQCRFSGNNSGYSGTLTLDALTGEGKLRLTSATAGSAAATWNVTAGNTLQVHGVSVQLGQLQGDGSIVNSHTSDPAAITVKSGTFNGLVSGGLAPLAMTKTSTGTLSLNGFGNNCNGGTVVDDGTLLVNGALFGPVQVNAAATLGGMGWLDETTTVFGTIAPGASVGQLSSSGTVTLAAGSDFNVEIGDWSGATAGVDWDLLAAGALVFTATPANKLVIHVSGSPANFTESGKVLMIAESTGENISGFDPAAVAVDSSGFAGNGTWSVQLAGNGYQLLLSYTPGVAGNPFATWASSKGLTAANNGFAADPDRDGDGNSVEFALDGNPMSGTASGKRVGKIATVGGQQAFTLTLPVRNGAVFAGTTEQAATRDGVVYRIQAGNDLASWPLAVSEVTGADATAIQAGLPALSSGWTYRTFRSPGPVSADPREFLRVVIDPAP